MIARLLALLACLAPAAATALEPRFDHRDEWNLGAALTYARDTVSVPGEPTRSEVRPGLRLSGGFDVSGEGDELIFGAEAVARSWDDPARDRVRLVLDGRYRAYFGTEELKTFFDVGLWCATWTRVSVGPLVGVGVQWDFDRATGVYLTGSFATGLGQARVASLGVAGGFQIRFE